MLYFIVDITTVFKITVVSLKNELPLNVLIKKMYCLQLQLFPSGVINGYESFYYFIHAYTHHSHYMLSFLVLVTNPFIKKHIIIVRNVKLWAKTSSKHVANNTTKFLNGTITRPLLNLWISFSSIFGANVTFSMNST